ncbi:hypothetical protein KCP76_18685 [Salmonella enterica subsp. enterica serovar Weltevreden]|nr:hypothetical protein KCP76_18685 [Salmonella enterica subsp. enterica serovar Weltevreden]
MTGKRRLGHRRSSGGCKDIKLLTVHRLNSGLFVNVTDIEGADGRLPLSVLQCNYRQRGRNAGSVRVAGGGTKNLRWRCSGRVHGATLP